MVSKNCIVIYLLFISLSIISGLDCASSKVKREPEISLKTKQEEREKIRLRTYPYPYKATITIADDIDRQDWEDFKYIQNFYNKHDIEMGASFWMYHDSEVYPSPEIEFSYFDGISHKKSQYADAMAEYMRCGVFESLHTFAQTQPRNSSNLGREDYKYAIKELKDEIGVYIKHWINHGDSPDKVGPDIWDRCIGDNPGSSYYHTDFTNYDKSGGYYTFEFYHTWQGAYNEPCYTIPEDVITLDSLDDGTKVYSYSRYHGVDDPPRSNDLHLQLRDENLKSIVDNGGVCIIYMHLGTVDVCDPPEGVRDPGIDEVYPPLTPFGEEQLIKLSNYNKKGDIYVTTTTKLLQYNLAWKRLIYTVDGWDIIIHSIDDEVRGSYIPTIVDLQGITFYTPDPESTKVFIVSKEVTNEMIKNPSDGASESVSFPLLRITRPDDYPCIFEGIKSRIYTSGGIYNSVSYNEVITDRTKRKRVFVEVELPFNCGELNIYVSEYSTDGIFFKAHETVKNMVLKVYDREDIFQIIDGEKYVLKKDEVIFDTQIAIDKKVKFLPISIGGTYSIERL